MQRCRGFTLVEIAVAVVIILLLLMLAVPSLTGVLADRRLRRSLEGLNELVRHAQERSVTERRPYLIAWGRETISLRPVAAKEDEAKPIATFPIAKGDALILELPAALEKNPPWEWIFWPSGNCEPAIVKFKGADGSWTARYSALTARPELTAYAAR